MSEIAIRVEQLGKRYKIGRLQKRHDTLRDSISDFGGRIAGLGKRTTALGTSEFQKPKAEMFWALREISFEVQRGEVVGIIGRNGAGKSTLLKILSRITEPTEGTVDIYGRVGSLLEVGTGFHPELTGRENIFLSGAIMGMRRSEIFRKFDEIVAFAEVEKFIDTPVKRYSSGMYVRLAFAVAAFMEPEILLIDEVLAVGDAAFQKKCLGKMSDVAHDGRTVLFVSHNMGTVASLCERIVYLANGRVQANGPAAEIIAQYLGEGRVSQENVVEKFRHPGYGKHLRFTQIAAEEGAGALFGAPLSFDLELESDIDASDLTIGASLFDLMGACIGTLFTTDTFSLAAGGRTRLRLTVRNLNLAPGTYYAGFSAGWGGTGSLRRDLDVIIGIPEFQVLPMSDRYAPVSHWASSWGALVLTDTQLQVVDR